MNWLSSSPTSSHSAPPPGSGSSPVEHEKQDRLDIKGRLWQPSDMEASSSDETKSQLEACTAKLDPRTGAGAAPKTEAVSGSCLSLAK